MCWVPPQRQGGRWEQSCRWSSPRCASCGSGGCPASANVSQWLTAITTFHLHMCGWLLGIKAILLSWKKLRKDFLGPQRIFLIQIGQNGNQIWRLSQHLYAKEGVFHKVEVNVWGCRLQQDGHGLPEVKKHEGNVELNHLRMVRVVPSTRKLKMNVQIGSIRLHSGWKLKIQSEGLILLWRCLNHLEVDDDGSKEDTDGLKEVADDMDKGCWDVDVFVWGN